MKSPKLFSYSREFVAEPLANRDCADLIGRGVDFWLIGGISCLACLLLHLLGRHFTHLFAAYRFVNFFLFSNFFTVIVAYPHFLSTYRIAYGRGPQFVRQQWFTLVAVPILGVAFFGLAYLRFNQDSSSLFDGRTLVTWSVVVLFVFSGWHHAQQAYGCFKIYGRLSNYELNRGESAHLRKLVALLWIDGVVNTQIFYPFENKLSTIQYPNLHLPLWVGVLLTIVTWIYIFWIGYRIVYRKWRAEGRWPPATSLVAIASLIAWWTLPFYQAQYYLLYSIIFHPLQYAPFGLRHEATQAPRQFSYRFWISRLAILMLFGAVIGAAIPSFIDLSLNTSRIGEGAFFLIAAQVIINIHHFFIDAKIWKTSHPDVKQLIYRQLAP